MTDKQIIIDGVDVSGCTRYCADNGKCTAFKSQYLCSERNNCYTKRILKKNKTINILKEKLLHKEQECERLKIYIESNEQQVKEVETLVMDNDRLINELDQLKAANEILKEKFEIAIKNNMDKTLLRLKNGDVQEELQEIREQFGIETLYFHDDNTRVHRCLDVLRLKDTLAEIKEALQFYKNTKIGVDKGNGIFELEVSNDNIGKLVYCYNTNPAKEALQKISEVEEQC